MKGAELESGAECSDEMYQFDIEFSTVLCVQVLKFAKEFTGICN